MKIDINKYDTTLFVFGIGLDDWNYISSVGHNSNHVDCIFYDENNFPLKIPEILNTHQDLPRTILINKIRNDTL